jgi:ParB family transcriptional regulator, chromosome partitioning protein
MGDKYEVFAGYRRVEAARRAGHTTIPAIVDEISDTQAKLRSLMLNILHKKRTVTERVEAYRELMPLDHAWGTYRGLARAIGYRTSKSPRILKRKRCASDSSPTALR